MKQSLQTKIVVVMWGMIILSTIMAAILSGSLIIRSHQESIDEQLQAAATSLISLGISDFSELNDFEQLDEFISDSLKIEQVNKIVRIYDSSKKLVYTTVGFAYDPLPNTLEGKINRPEFLELQGKERVYKSLVIPYQATGKKHPYYLQIVIPLPKYFEILKALSLDSSLLLGLLILVSLILSRSLAKRLLKPVQNIADYLEKIEPLKIEEWQPMALDRKEYLNAIAEGINLLAERTRSAVLELRKMSRYVAHELRTPLTILQGEAETVLYKKKEVTKEDYEQVLRSSLEEIQRMSGIVTTVLKIGEYGENTKIFHISSYDLVKWAQKNTHNWERTLGRPIKIEIGSEERPQVYVDPDLLFRLVDNLVRNVRDHTPPKTQCTLVMKSLPGDIRLSVHDDGPGLSQAVIDSLNIKKGSSEVAGLGFDLCYKIVKICGLNLNISNRSEGGLCVEICF